MTQILPKLVIFIGVESHEAVDFFCGIFRDLEFGSPQVLKISYKNITRNNHAMFDACHVYLSLPQLNMYRKLQVTSIYQARNLMTTIRKPNFIENRPPING